MRIIGLVGPKGSGKDTVADFLKSMNISNGKIAFAGPLKKICANVFNLDASIFEDRILKEKEFEQPIVFMTDHICNLVTLMNEYIPDPELSVERFEKFLGLNFISPRNLLQQVGTEVIRSYSANWHTSAAFSAKNMKESSNKEINKDSIFCITDIRFMNEFELIRDNKNNKSKIFYVERPEAERELLKSNHQSELEILQIKKYIDNKYVLKNHKGLEELKELIIKRITSKKFQNL